MNSSEVTHVKHLATVCNVRKENINEWMLPVERRAAPVFARHDPLNRWQIALAERVVLVAKNGVLVFWELSGAGPIIDDIPAYERRNLLTSIPTVKEQAVPVVGAIVYGKSRELKSSRAALVFQNVDAFSKKAYLSFCGIGHLCTWGC